MPIIKTVREDVLRSEEVDAMLGKLTGKDELVGEYRVKSRGGVITQHFRIDCRQAECIIALLWLFGKRISEILSVKRREVWSDEKFLYVRFHVLKKRRKAEVIPAANVKRITLSNRYVRYVLDYVSRISDVDAYLFPANTGPRIARVRADVKDRDGNPVKKVYTYQRQGGFLSTVTAWKWIKHLNPKAYCHLFRHSLATQMAEVGATEDELLNWFDWSDRSAAIAHGYVSRGTRLTEKWSERTW